MKEVVPDHQIAPYVTGLDDIEECRPTDVLSTALSNLSSTHQAVFVFSEDEAFQGLISPRFTLGKHRYPPQTKVDKLMFRPMHITPETPLTKVAEQMMSSRVYTLPVFDEKDTVINKITAEAVLNAIMTDSDLLQFVESTVTINKPITASANDAVKDVYALLKKHNISRVILTDDQEKVQGVVSYRDLFPVFTTPNQQRTKTSTKIGGRQNLRMRSHTYDQERIFRKDDRVRTYMTREVVTIGSEASLTDILSLMQSAAVNSLVIVEKNHPIGIISRFDFLKALAHYNQAEFY